MENRLILAGSTVLYGLEEIKDSFKALGIEVSFCDADFMKPFADSGESVPVDFIREIPAGKKIIPLSEVWISECIEKNCALISQRALRSSRSKKILYKFLSENGVRVPEVYSGIEKALEVLSAHKKVVIKPEGLNSGYGIEIIGEESRDKLEKYFLQASTLTNHAMKIMRVKCGEAMLTECIEGTEYSADCFFFKGRISVARLCSKKIVLVNDKPCCLYCRLEKPDPQITEALERWTSLLFDGEDISFAQYDFVKAEDGNLVPIDFAPRVGGGMRELFRQCGDNVYARSVSGTESRAIHGLCQFNYLPVKSGRLQNDSIAYIEGKRTVYKKKGDYVTGNPSSASSRIAVVISKPEEMPGEDTLRTLLIQP